MSRRISFSADQDHMYAALYALGDAPSTVISLAVQLWVVVSVIRGRGSFLDKSMWVLLIVLFQLITCAFWFALKEKE